MSGHARASFTALAGRGTELLLAYRVAIPGVPYDDEALELGVIGQRWSDRPDEAELQAEVERFAPDVLLVCSWDVGAYRRIARRLRGRTLRILCMDNAWLGTLKQWGGRTISPAVIRPAYDIAFLPGERQAAFARRLGFGDDRILWGLYTCDYEAFSAAGRATDPGAGSRHFVFVGRLVEEKGVDVLAAAYRRYRRTVRAPWPLSVCGAGPLAPQLQGVDGVELRGFVQPSALPAVLARSGCLVLPSRFEPWGVVIHEATACGLPVVCSTACGASSRLVVDGYNGLVVRAGDPDSLCAALANVAERPDRLVMGRRSRELAAQFTPDRWADYLLERSVSLRSRLGLDATPPLAPVEGRGRRR